MIDENSEIEARKVVAENYENLAYAIVKQAIDEYKAELRRVAERAKNAEKPASMCYSPKMRELEEFIMSDWFSILCTLEGQAVIDALRGLILPDMEGDWPNE